MALQQYTEEWLRELCVTSHSLAEVLRKAGRKQSGGNQDLLKKKIAYFNIDVSHFAGQSWSKGKNKYTDKRLMAISNNKEKYSIDEIFIKNSPVTQKVLRKYVEKYNILKYECCKCGCDGKWQNGIIALELDHIDGDNKNNERSNLRYLCPNCHALTKTYRGRNKALKNRKLNV